MNKGDKITVMHREPHWVGGLRAIPGIVGTPVMLDHDYAPSNYACWRPLWGYGPQHWILLYRAAGEGTLWAYGHGRAVEAAMESARRLMDAPTTDVFLYTGASVRIFFNQELSKTIQWGNSYLWRASY